MSGYTPRPWSADVVRERVNTHATVIGRNSPIQEQDLIPVIASMARLVRHDNGKRKAILRYLFGVTSTKQLTTGQARAIRSWIGATPNEDGEWVNDPNAVIEAERIIVADNIEQGQTMMQLGGDSQ